MKEHYGFDIVGLPDDEGLLTDATLRVNLPVGAKVAFWVQVPSEYPGEEPIGTVSIEDDKLVVTGAHAVEVVHV